MSRSVYKTTSEVRDASKGSRLAPVYLTVTLVTIYFVVRHLHGSTALEAAETSVRGDLYISLAATTAALLGFAITAISILLALTPGRRMQWLLDTAGREAIQRVFVDAIKILGCSTLTFSGLILFDTGTEGSPVGAALTVAAVVASSVAVFRAVWLLENLLSISDSDASDNGPPPNPPFNEPV